MEKGESIAELKGHTGPIECCAISRDGSMYASSSNDGTVRLWDARTNDVKHVLKDHEGEVDSVTLTPDGAVVISGCKDKLIRLWDVQKGELLNKVSRHTGRVESLELSSDGELLATGGGGGETSVRLWEMKDLLTAK